MDHQFEARARRIRTAVATLTPGSQRRYPPSLRAEIAAYAREYLRGGGSRFQVCKALGVSDPTIGRLLGETAKEKPRLRRVRLVAPAPAGAMPSATAIVVRAPGGIVIEGLDAVGVAALVRALS